jgi:hypothetical protein
LTANGVAANILGANVLVISVNGVIQEPGEAYIMDGDDIIFSEAPPTISSFYGIDVGTTGIGTPGDGTITSSKFITDNTASTGKVLGVNSSGELSWVTVGGGVGATDLDGLSDVSLVLPMSGQVLRFNGSNFVNARLNYSDLQGPPSLAAVATSGSYNDLTNKPAYPTDLNGFTDSTGIVTTENKTLVQFGTKPNYRDTVKIICIGSSIDTDSTGTSIVRVNRQALQFEGSTRSFDLDTFVSLNRASPVAAMVVELNGVALKGVDTIYNIYDGITNEFVLGLDPEEPAGAILTSNINVFVNNEVQTVIEDYIYNGATKVLTIESSILTKGDTIKIENNAGQQVFQSLINQAQFYVDLSTWSGNGL